MSLLELKIASLRCTYHLRGIIRVEDLGFKVVHEFQDNASNRGIPWEVDVVLGIFGLIFHG